MTRYPLIVVGLLLLAGCTGGPAAHGDVANSDEICIRGAFTDEGIECPAFRGEDGTLYTLAGVIDMLAPGAPACVCGEPAEMSYCMQGVTITVSRVGPPEAC